MLLKYLDQLKVKMDKHEFLMVINAVEDKIKFTRIKFNKITPTDEFINITEKTIKEVMRCQ